MASVEPVGVLRFVLDIRPDRSITLRERKPGPPERIDGMTVGVVAMAGESPHNGEMHPDGDELLYVVSAVGAKPAAYQSHGIRRNRNRAAYST